MRSASVNLTAHLQQATTKMALCFRVTRYDGTKHCFTSHDQNLTIGGDVYRSDISFTASQGQVKAGLSVDNAELAMPLATGGITKADVLAGLFYRAELDVFWCNWDDLTMGVMYEAKTWFLGKATLKENRVTFEVRSLSSLLASSVIDVITPDCPYQFGLDDGYRSFCPANIGESAGAYETTGTVESVDGTEPQRIFTDASFADSGSDELYEYGVVRWDTGNNAGYQMEVETCSAVGEITLLLNMPFDIEVGDTFTIWKGCDKTFDTCKAFGFGDDFGGYPNVPSQDEALQYRTG